MLGPTSPGVRALVEPGRLHRPGDRCDLEGPVALEPGGHERRDVTHGPLLARCSSRSEIRACGAHERHPHRFVPRGTVLLCHVAGEGHALPLGRTLLPQLLAVLAPAVVPVLRDARAAFEAVDADGAVRTFDARHHVVRRAGRAGREHTPRLVETGREQVGPSEAEKAVLDDRPRGGAGKHPQEGQHDQRRDTETLAPAHRGGVVVHLLGHRIQAVRLPGRGLPGRRLHVPDLSAGTSSSRDRRSALSVTEQTSP
jgi:hypothetical protein